MAAIHNPGKIMGAFAVIRDRQKRYGDVVIPRRVECVCCHTRKEVTEMHRIPTTGIVENVMDCLCNKCLQEHVRDFSQMARVVCAGCREVVAVVSPGKEKRGGFVWRPGAITHVAQCPACTQDPNLQMSRIAEKVAFYVKNGIPFE